MNRGVRLTGLALMAAGALAACEAKDTTNTPAEEGTIDGLFNASVLNVAEEVQAEIIETLPLLAPEGGTDDSDAPLEAGEPPLGEPDERLIVRTYQRPSGLPDGQDLYLFPKHADPEELTTSENFRRKVGSITRSYPVAFDEYYAEAPEGDVNIDAQWNFRLNWLNRGSAPFLKEEDVANTRWQLVTTFDGGKECQVILYEEDFVYLHRGGGYGALIDCGEITLPQTTEGKAHQITLQGAFPHADDTGWYHHSLGGMYANLTPEFKPEDGLDTFMRTENVGGRIASGRITFFETPQNEIVVASMFPFGLTGRLRGALHGERGFWGVVEGDPIRVSASNTSFSAGYHVRNEHGEIIETVQWDPDETDATIQSYSISLGSIPARGDAILIPSEDREVSQNSLLKPESCVINQECPLSDDEDEPDMYQQAAINELGGEGCPMPDEVCAIAPAAFTAGINGNMLPNYESDAFLDRDHFTFGETWYSIDINSLTADAESMTFVYRDGTKVEMDSELTPGGVRVFTTPEGQRVPSIGDDHIETVFGTCFSTEVDTDRDIFEYTECSCGDMVQELQGEHLVWVCPDSDTEQD